MIDQGPARHYLQEVCPAPDSSSARISNSLPARSYEFLWSTDKLRRLGGFEGMHDEASGNRGGTIRTHPNEVATMAVRNIGITFPAHAPGAELNFAGRTTLG